jgi:hypothetical protein
VRTLFSDIIMMARTASLDKHVDLQKGSSVIIIVLRYTT